MGRPALSFEGQLRVAPDRAGKNPEQRPLPPFQLFPYDAKRGCKVTDSMRYEKWTKLLSEVVTESGKVDYVRLAHHRQTLNEVINEFAASSPEDDPAEFPSEEDQLAYRLNAYNLFTLHAIMDEYPVTSVWKTRDGQFFNRRRHIAGGKSVSLDDIEHQILRTRFAEPRIHFAINAAPTVVHRFVQWPFKGRGCAKRSALRRGSSWPMNGIAG